MIIFAFLFFFLAGIGVCEFVMVYRLRDTFEHECKNCGVKVIYPNTNYSLKHDCKYGGFSETTLRKSHIKKDIDETQEKEKHEIL